MKKLLAFLMTAALLLACAGALAENVRFVEDSNDFDVEMPLPDGASVASVYASGEVSVTEIAAEGLASVRISVAPSELYEQLSMNDLSEDEVQALCTVAGEQFDNPETTVDVTPSGNKYIHICANAEYDIDSIFTLYMGYFIEMTQWHDDYSEITDADYAFMQQLLYNLSFLPVTK